MQSILFPIKSAQNRMVLLPSSYITFWKFEISFNPTKANAIREKDFKVLFSLQVFGSQQLYARNRFGDQNVENKHKQVKDG